MAFITATSSHASRIDFPYITRVYEADPGRQPEGVDQKALARRRQYLMQWIGNRPVAD